jgi:hypothetical protein
MKVSENCSTNLDAGQAPLAQSLADDRQATQQPTCRTDYAIAQQNSMSLRIAERKAGI